MTEEEFRELSAGHALGTLSDEDDTAFAVALAGHPEWQPIVDEDIETAALLGEATHASDPPAPVREQLLGRLDSVPQIGTPPMADRPSQEPEHPVELEEEDEDAPVGVPRRRFRRLFALAASIVLIASVALGAQTLLNRSASSPAELALQQLATAPDATSSTGEIADGGTATLSWSASLGTAVLVARGLPTIESDRAFELWIVRGETPISAGLVEARDGSAVMLLDRGVDAGDLVAVTVEPAGGSPSGAPTSEPILALPAA